MDSGLQAPRKRKEPLGNYVVTSLVYSWMTELIRHTES